MFNEIKNIKTDNENFELPRTLDNPKYSSFELPRSLFKETQIEKKENTIEATNKICSEVNHTIAESLIEKTKEGKKLRFKNIQDNLVKPTLKDTIISVASAAPVFIALEKTNPELVSENTKGLKRDVYKFYKNNLKEISKTDNTENIKKFSDSLDVSVDKLKSKAKDLTDVTMKIAADSIYIAGKVMLDTGAAIEAGIITGLEKTAEFANQPELAAKISEIGVFKDLSNEYSKCYEHSKELDKVVLKIEEIPFTIAELYLAGYVSEVYLATKVILGAGQIVEHAGKFVLEVGAKAVGQDEFASKVQKSHIVDDISKAVDTQLEKTLGEIDKISDSIDVFAAIEGKEVAGNVGETIGEIGSEIAICIAATATGNIPLAVGMIALSACDAGGQAIDVAVDKTGKFTWKETLVGVGTAAVDAASLGLSRGFTKAVLKTTETGANVSKIGKIGQKIPGKFGKVLEGSVIAGVDSGIFQLSDVANPILEKRIGIDKDAKIDWKKIGISTGIGFATGGLFAYIGEVIKANKIKKVEKEVFKELEILNKKGNNFLKETINEGSSNKSVSEKIALGKAKAANKTEVVGKQITKVEKVQDNVSKLDKIDDVSNKSVPEKIFLDKTTDVASNVEKTRMTEKIEIKFKCNEGIDPVEMQRQLKGQERGLNSQTLAENIRNRERYKLEGRSPEGDVAQSIRRQKAEASRVNSNLKKGMSLDDARKEASDWIQTQAALHNPDQIAGGDPGIVSRMGDASVNSSIGAQWRTRVAKLEEEINNYIKGKSQAEIENTLLNVSLKMEIA